MFRKKEKQVVIEIRGGCATPVILPKGVKVKIVDYDVEGLDPKRITNYEGEDANVTDW